ncbi:MAG: thioester reductase domain-containing protein [Cyanophyceae cyanobacterium]
MEPIAIIGMGCRFPGASNPKAFWELLQSGGDAITEVPGNRWDVDAFYASEPATPGKMNTRWGGFLEQVDQFDPGFFNISPREAERLDPQQRLMLEVAWECLEDAGIAPQTLSGSQTGVFIAIGNYDYGRLLAQDLNQISAYDGTGNTLCIAANRLSYLLNLRGPSMVVETACSSSLVAVHVACQSLRQGESELCLVGGVSLMLSPEPTINYSQARMMASDGRCKTFDARADGYVRGEGGGAIALKRLSDALRDGDTVRAVIRGSAVNQDGLSNGLTAPNGPSQQRVIRQALDSAGVAPAQISYVEAHGTGTALGDPIEAEFIQAALREGRQADQPCWIGSVKTNIGHLEAAAGLASLIKVVLALQHREIPPHLHLQQLNPYITLEASFRIPTENQRWNTPERIAGISAFGFGGTNCHAVLAAAPEVPASANKVDRRKAGHCDRPLHLLTLSAKSADALKELAQRYAVVAQEEAIADVCFTANTGRAHFNHRLAVPATDAAQLRTALEAFATGAELASGHLTSKKRPKIAFLFTGQGSQYVGMGQQLYETQPTFRAALDRCATILAPYLDYALLELLYPQQPSALLDETAYTQPALFALEYALAQMWMAWGIKPAIVMGHSVGEYVAACLAGVFSLEDGLKLIAARGRLMQALPANGAMVAVMAGAEQVAAAIAPYPQVALAALNGPRSVVISGRSKSVEAVRATLTAQGIKTKPLTVSHAFHSPLMEPMLADFEAVASEVTYFPPTVKLISNVTGALATAEIATPQYWCRHLRQPVRFADGIKVLQAQADIGLECGPKPILTGMGRLAVENDGNTYTPLRWLASLEPRRSPWQTLLQSLAQLYVGGVAVDWMGFDRDYHRCRVVLPTYPFQRQRYWFKEANGHRQASSLALPTDERRSIEQQLLATGQLSADEAKVLPKLLNLLSEQQQTASLQDWFYQIEWQPQPRPVASERDGSNWLIFADDAGTGPAIAQQGQRCFLVYPGKTYQHQNGIYYLNPSRREDFERLFQELSAVSQEPLSIVYLWTGQEYLENLPIWSGEQPKTWGCGCVLYLVQALVKHGRFTAAQLWLVTRAVPVGTQPELSPAPLGGLGKVIALEHPELWGGTIDLAPEPSADEGEMLLAAMDLLGEQIACREGQLYVARLVRRQLSDSPPVPFRSDGTYLITGGLGALGLRVARWLVERGVQHLVLTSRRGASPSVQEVLNQLRGAEVRVVQADVSDRSDMNALFDEMQTSLPPLRGVIHAAGVLDDGILLHQDWQQFSRVLAPKVEGAWNLHQLTQHLPLDFFVMFSSAASVLGSPGQGNYAAANAFLDALAHYRCFLGLPGLSINWGPWSDGGMAAKLSSRYGEVTQGSTIAPEQGLQALAKVLGLEPQVAVLPFEWSAFQQQFGAGTQLPLLAELVSPTQAAASNQRSILSQWQEADEGDRSHLLTTYIQGQVAKLLEVAPAEIDIHQSLQDLGFDSLMAVDLRNAVQTQLQAELPIRAFIEEPSVANLLTLLTEQLTPGKPTAVVNEVDLDAEATLERTIAPGTDPVELITEPTAVLLTGATGFLGAFLLYELLQQTQADIYCLVRTADAESGYLRLQQNLATYALWQQDFRARIVPVVGDLAQPQLGLANDQWQHLAAHIETIYHNGAFLSYVYPYSRLKSINVLGTQEVLKLATTDRIKPVHHVSSVAVFESSAFYGKAVTEADLVVPSEGIYLGYSQSKWVSERLVTKAGERGLPMCIYRPPLISGHSRTGVWNTSGFLCRMIKGCIQMGSMADLDVLLDLSPVDYVAQAIVYLSKQKQSFGQAFHLQNPSPLHWSQLSEFMRFFGYAIDREAYSNWQAKLNDSRDNPLYPLLPFFVHRWLDDLTYIELNQQDKRPKIGCQATLAALADSNIDCPPLDFRLLDTYFSYLVRSGFISAPVAARRI